jgi:hypothetical protein
VQAVGDWLLGSAVPNYGGGGMYWLCGGDDG